MILLEIVMKLTICRILPHDWCAASSNGIVHEYRGMFPKMMFQDEESLRNALSDPNGRWSPTEFHILNMGDKKP